jgi:hypothetical protein
MLAELYSSDYLRNIIPPYGNWKPYPDISSRNTWQSLPPSLQQAIIKQGEACLEYNWPSVPATLFLEYKRNGNRSHYERAHFKRRSVLRDLILAECVENQGRFLDQIVNGIWLICEETYWGIPAHINMQAVGTELPDATEPTVDLFAAETVALLSWAHYLLGEKLDTVSLMVRPRIVLEAQRRVLESCLAREDFWWMGFDPGRHGINNWNPWVNSNWLTAVLLLEQDFDRRINAVSKILHSLDFFIDIYAEAGGCDEGPGYWGRAAASLFDCLDQLYSASNGAIDVFGNVKISNMGKFIYRTQIADDYYVNYADASALNHPPASLVYRYGQAINDPDMMAFGGWLAQGQPTAAAGRDSMSRELPRIFTANDMQDVSPYAPLPRDVYFDGIQVMVARDQERSMDGFFLSAKGGHNAESHNHNDVGNFIIFLDGRPVIVDAGVETYTKKTFSEQRYEIWTMQSAYHNLLPILDGMQQSPGREYKAQDAAYRFDDQQAQFTVDIAGAYPAAANISSLQRTFTLNRGQDIEITDIVVMHHPVKEIVLSILTLCQVDVKTPGSVRFTRRYCGRNLQSGSGILDFDAARLAVRVEQVPIQDTKMGRVWGDFLNRVIFTLQEPSMHDTWEWRFRKD